MDSNPEQASALAGPANALPRIRKKDGAVVRAYQMHPFGIKKTPGFPIKLRWHVRTPIQIGVNPSLMSYHEADRGPAFMQDVKAHAYTGVGKFGTETDQAFDFSHSFSCAVLSMHASGLWGISFSRACAP